MRSQSCRGFSVWFSGSAYAVPPKQKGRPCRPSCECSILFERPESGLMSLLEANGVDEPFYRFSVHTPKFRQAAKVTQSKYGICSRAADLSTLRKDRIIQRINPHSASSQKKARPKF